MFKIGQVLSLRHPRKARSRRPACSLRIMTPAFVTELSADRNGKAGDHARPSIPLARIIAKSS